MNQPDLDGKRVLVVDDDANVRRAFRRLLEADGHLVTEAASGREALDALAKGQFDLVITDCAMPGMTGNELAVWIKQLAPRLPILMITTAGTDPGHPETLADRTLAKPVLLEDLQQAIQDLVTLNPGAVEPGNHDSHPGNSTQSPPP